MPVISIHSKEEFTTALANSSFKHTIVDFTASWCPPCQMIKPYFEEKSSEYKDIQFIKVDVDELSDLSGDAGIRAMPTFQIYKDGKKVDEIVGASKDKLDNLLKKYSSGASSSPSDATPSSPKPTRKEKKKIKCTVL